MSRPRDFSEAFPHNDPNLGDLLAARPSGLQEPETWAVLCQAVQALQDLFLSDGASGSSCIPLVTPSTLTLSARGRVKLCHSLNLLGSGPPAHLTGYLAPEYRINKMYTDTEVEKMWIFALGETLKRATFTSHAVTSRMSTELCRVLTDMTRVQVASRSSLMHLLDVISEYCRKRQQNRPFSHIVMDLHQEAMAAVEASMDTPWGPPAMPQLRPLTRNRSESSNEGYGTIPRRWMGLTRTHNDINFPKLTKEASTSMEVLNSDPFCNAPGSVVRPKSMCVPEMTYYPEMKDLNFRVFDRNANPSQQYFDDNNEIFSGEGTLRIKGNKENRLQNRRNRGRRNPVQRAASRLYRAGIDDPVDDANERNCVGPEFVVRAALPNKFLTLPDSKGAKRFVTVIMLNGQKLDIACNPNTTTAGQLFELIIQMEHIEENFMLGLSALIAGDFVFLPSDTRIYKAMQPGNDPRVNLTLFMRVRFFLPSLRGIKGSQARHLLYLQLRRSILEHQLPCSFKQIIELNGLALQAEFGNFIEREHGTRDYFLLDHYIPETMSCVIEDSARLRQELIKAHQSKMGLEPEKAEQDFISFAQGLPHYGGHFYTATWILKDNNNKEIWLYVSAQGINLYERGRTTSNFGPQLYERFEWKNIQTLCYSKHYLCILPHSKMHHASKLKKYKLKMDHKKSYFAFRLASLHHQFFLRLRTEFTSLQTLSQQFGIALKDIKNETNSLYKLEALTNPLHHMNINDGTVNAETEFKIDFRVSSRQSNDATSNCFNHNQARKSKSVQDLTNEDCVNEIFQNKENENPSTGGLILNSSCLSGIPVSTTEKRSGVKMGTRMFSNAGVRVSRSMEAVNATNSSNENLEQMSLQSVSFHCSSTSISKSSNGDGRGFNEEAYIIDSTLKACSQQQFLPDFQESLSASLLEKFSNISFAEERVLSSVAVERDAKGSLGMQITEGSDGNVYVQSVILGGPAHLSGNILSGDQIVAVDGQSLLGMKYNYALNLLKTRGNTVEFIVSRVSQKTNRQMNLRNRMNLCNINETVQMENENSKIRMLRQSIVESPVEKHLTESCHDISNHKKYNIGNDTVPYHKHIKQYNNLFNDVNTVDLSNSSNINKNISKSCMHLYSERDKAVVVDMIPKDNNMDWSHFRSLDRRQLNNFKTNVETVNTSVIIPHIPVPRSLGLSRKWRGPVRYPVTPVKKVVSTDEKEGTEMFTTSDDEQVFI